MKVQAAVARGSVLWTEAEAGKNREEEEDARGVEEVDELHAELMARRDERRMRIGAEGDMLNAETEG